MSMSVESRKTVIRLAKQLLQLLTATREPPFVLVLGSGVMSVTAIEDSLLLAGLGIDDVAARNLNPIQRASRFKDAWDMLTNNGSLVQSIAAAIRDLGADDRNGPRSGYKGLARLVADGYFEVIFTADVSTGLEDALISMGFPQSEWKVYLHPRFSSDEIKEALNRKEPRIKIVKVCGDVYDRFAFLRTEIRGFVEPMRPLLESYLSKSILLFGYDSARDHWPVSEAPNILYYVNQLQPAEDLPIWNAVVRRAGETVLAGQDVTFDSFFTELSEQLLGGDRPAQVGLAKLQRMVGGQKVVESLDDNVVEELAEAPAGDVERLITTLVPAPRRETQPSEPAGGDLLELVSSQVMFITFGNDQRLSFRLQGPLKDQGEPSSPLDLDLSGLNRSLQILNDDIASAHASQDRERHATWMERAFREGKLLYKNLFASNAQFMQSFGMALNAARSGENLLLCFEGPRNFLGMPYEFLYDNGPLAIRHSISRKVTGVPAGQRKSFNDFLAPFGRSRAQPLRILLIASDTEGTDADAEVDELTELLNEKGGRLYNIEVVALKTAEASVDRIRQSLRKCPFHLVHYSGHSDFNRERPEDSRIVLWNKTGGKGGKGSITARELAVLLEGSQTQLFYLNSCVGAMVGTELPRAQTYIGLQDAIVQAGIPTVLGYRWKVVDSSARKFARSFYQSLLETRCPTRATHRARKAVYAPDAPDETWASPVLVVQEI